MGTRGRTSRRRLIRSVILAISLLVLVPGVASTAGALGANATGESALMTISPANQTQPSGAAQTYTINLSCQGTGGGACGPNLTVTIPLDTSTTPSMTDPSWLYTAASTPGTLLASGPTVVGTDLVMTLDPTVFVSGFSGAITLKATPPNDVTPNRTTWQMAPTLTGNNITPVTVPTPATSTATASPKVSITKATADGGSVYTVGSPITYSMNAKCTTDALGSLFLENATIVDPLPAGLTYVSSTPAGGVFDPSSNAVTWSFTSSDLATMPAGCAPGATGPTSFSVTATAPATVPSNPLLNNTVSFSGTGPDAQDPGGVTSSSSAQVPVQLIAEPNVGPGPGYVQITKGSLAPIAQPGITSGNQYIATFSGNWLPPSSSPSYATYAAAAMFQTTVTYGLVGTYQTDLYDPVPCLTAPAANVYSSPSYSAPACTNVAFHTQVIQINAPGYDTSSNGLGQAYANGWRPTATLTDGTVITLTASGTVGTTSGQAYFAIPSGATVSVVRLPPDPALRNRTLQLTMWGYADASLATANGGLNQLHNTATAIPQITPDSPLAPQSYSADLFTIPTKPQLGIAKSFGTPGAAANGTTALNIVGSVTTLSALTQNLVITDLLPTGITWANPVATGTWTLTQGGAASPTTTPISTEVIDNYQGSGRQLIRVTIPATSIAAGGSWTATPPANFFRVTTPTAIGSYVNTDQIYLYDSQLNGIQDTCATPTQVGGGISTATYESDNAADLAGDGQLQEAYCENRATLTIKGTGAAFALTKTVQGNLDAVPRGALGVGNASQGGTGTFGLRWSNVGSNVLGQPVIYDILPHAGDTGVSQGQAGVARSSQFTPVFASIGTLPSGVSVQYSTSLNPCRNEVFPDAANPTCVNDWTSTAPGDVAKVTALRFASSASYQAGEGFAVTFTVTVPSSDINAIAWNSAATNATDVANPSNVLLPAEPPKVGIVAPVNPLIATSTSKAVTTAYAPLSDTVTVTGTGGGPGTLQWSLLGPVEPVANSCDALGWTGAPVEAHGSVTITGDGTYTAGPATLGSGGCYSWSQVLISTDANRPYGATSDPGATGETTIATPYPPSLVTTAELSVAGDGTRTLHDHVVIDDIPVAAPAPTPLTWTLYGPITPGSGRSCSGLSWGSAPVYLTGTVPVTGNGTYDTPGEVLSASGCYSYSEHLPATANSPAVTDAAGKPGETVLIADPEVITSTSASVVHLWATSTDSIAISGTQGGTGSLAWSLVGPVAPVGGGCSDVDWTSAATVAQGTIAIPGDGTYLTDPVAGDRPGCYSWTEELTSGTFPSPTTIGAGAPNESFLVQPLQPTIATTATAVQVGSASAGAVAPTTVSDRVTLAGTGLSSHVAAPTSNSLRWALFGPLAAVNGSCAGLSWTGAPTLAVGALNVTKDGTYTTPSTSLGGAGCYSYEEELGATVVSSEVIAKPGTPSETILLSATAPVTPGVNGGSTTPPPATGGTSGGGTLAMTGDNVARLLAMGALLVSVGLALISRRRRRAAEAA